MEKNWRFVYQENQFWGECLPCTLAVFNTIIDSAQVAWKIATRQEIDKAIAEGLPLDKWTQRSDFQQFCIKNDSEKFRLKTTAEKLLQWTNFLKMSLPCFIFAACAFDLVPMTDKLGNPILDDNGQPVMKRRRKLEGIHLSGLFMFDADHLPMDPREVFLRTQVPGFPWEIPFSHVTSSGWGLRLVVEAKNDIRFGNIADQQIQLARDLGLMGMIGTTNKPVVDDSCIDASRISYACRRQDILYLDEKKLFNL